MSTTPSDTKKPRRDYESPKFVHTERLEGRAVGCAKENDANCGGSPVAS